MTDAEVTALDSRLPKGWLAIAAERCGLLGLTTEYGSISRVKNGKRDNQEVLDVLIAIAEEEDERKAALSKRILGTQA